MAKSIALVDGQFLGVGFPCNMPPFSQRLKFVAKGFIKPKEVSSLIGVVDGKVMCFTVLVKTLKHDSVSGDFEFYVLTDLCNPFKTRVGGMPIAAAHSTLVMDERAASSSIVVTETFKIEYNGLRAAPAPVFKHAGWEVGCAAPSLHHLALPILKDLLIGEGDLSITIIDDDDTPTSETFLGKMHYVISPLA